MANNSPTIVVGSLNDEELKKSIDKLVANVDEGLQKMLQSTKSTVSEMNKTLKSLGDTKVTFGGAADGGSNRRTKAQNAETKAVNDTTASYDQQAQAMQAAEKTASKYSDAIIRQAQAIRESQQWKEKGFYISGDINYYDPERANMTKRQKEQLLSLEEQILAQTKQREDAERRAAAATREEAEALNVATNGFKVLNSTQNKGIGVYSQKAAKTGGTEDYMGMLQRVLGLQQHEIQNVNEETDSYRRLAAQLKQLGTAYDRLTASERNSENGKQLVGSMLEIRRAMQEIQRQKSRPVRLEDVLAFQPKNLDQMADKLRELKAYRGGIDITKKGAENEIIKTDAAIKKLTQDMNKYMYTSKELQNVNSALTRSFNYMKNRLAFYFTVGASTAFVKNLIDIRAQYEMNERALGILINSAERGSQIFKELSNMALVSPYTLIELSSAAKQLTAYDVAAKDVVDTTRRLADMAAAVGIPIERLTYALGQIKAYGYLNARDARMFSNAGIPLIKQLSEYYSELEGKLVSTADVYDRIKKKTIDYNTVMQVVNKMTDEGGKFFDFQAKMADTLKVRLANLTLAWNNMLNDIGQSNQGILTWTIGMFRDLFAHWKEFDSALKSVAWAGGLMVALRALNFILVKSGLQWSILSKEMTAAGIAGTGVARRMTMLGASLKAIATSPLTWWSLLAFAVVDVTRAILNMDEAQKQLSESIKNGAKDNYENITKFLDQYKTIRDGLYNDSKKTPNDIDDKEASKAWSAIKEQIELTTKNADAYIGRLESINNVSEKVRQGFNLLDDIRVVNAALKEVEEDTIKIEGDFMKVFGFTIGDGLITNLKDFADKLKSITDEYGSLENAQIAAARGVEGVAGDLHNLSVYLDTLQQDIATTNESIINFIQLKGWSNDINKISETFSSIYNKIAIDNNLSAQQALQLRLNSASAEYDALLNALNRHIADENVALSKARDDNEKADIESRLNVYKNDLAFLQSNTARSRVYWEDFTKWMSEQHKSEVQAMFNGQSAEQIKILDFSRGEYYKWVTELAQKYAKEHGMSYKQVYDQLHNYILNANQWSIRIPLIITTQDTKSEFQTLSEADAAMDAAWKKIQRLETRQKELQRTPASKLTEQQQQEETKIVQELTDAWNDYNDAKEKGGHSKKEDAAANKNMKAAETELAKALKEELQLIDKVRSSYKSLTDDGYNRKDAISLATDGLEESVANINSVLSKYGLKFDVTKFAGITNPREIVDMLQEQVNKLANTAKPAEIQALQLKIKDFKIDAAKFDQKTFADSLNNELGKLNQEYELAVSLDADPEFGSMFADMFGINLDSLPRTVSEYADEYTKLLNKYLSDNKTGIELPHLYLTDDNLHAFEQMVKEEKLNAKVYEQIAAAVNNIRQKTRKDIEDTGKEWNSMIEKYGGLQAKLMNISKSSSMELRSLVKKFGSKEQIKAAIDLVDKIRISEDPQEIARLREELNKIINDITSKNTVALKVSEASNKGTDKLTSKAYWEDSKDSELYAMTFEDMSNVSTRAINLIIDRMDALKDKVKEDPASMKTLVKNIEDAENELIGRDPFGWIVKSIGEWILAVREAKTARNELNIADQKVSDAEQELDKARQRGNPVDIAVAEQKLTKARDEREKINMKLTKSENKANKSQEKLRKSLQDTADVLGNIQDVFSSVSKLFRAFGDDDTADVIDSICEGFSIMTTLIFGVIAALLLLKTANPELLALAAILSVIVGLFSFLSGQKNKNIDKQVKASEQSVKRLENAYKNLEYAVERAYGTAKYGAEQTALANKELQLVELKRQLQLERSRDSKYRDQDKIIDLEGQVIDLENEMRKTVEDITNDLLGISGVGSAAEEMVSAMIESFKNGEDWMVKFDDTFSDMIDNMIMKAIVGRVIGDRIQGIFDLVDQKIKNRGYEEQRTLLSLQGRQKEVEERISNLKTSAAAVGRESTPFVSVYERELADIKRQIAEAEKAYEDAVRVTPSDIDEIRTITNGFRDNVKNEFQAYMDMFGITFGQDADTSKLSSLQAGISSITEETAGALEAYMNSVSQQVYLHSELLTEIRDAIIGSDSDIGIGVQAQMLLQLQQSHQIQEAIHNILNGALTPSGRAFMVELSA